MKRFVVKLLTFSIPLIVAMIVPGYILMAGREIGGNIDDVLEGTAPYRIGFRYGDDGYRYVKWKSIHSFPKRTVMTLGSSRVLQFRHEMFTSSFYNAGFTVSPMESYLPFLKSLSSDKYPDYLIIGLDQWIFSDQWSHSVEKKPAEYWSKAFPKTPSVQVMTNVWKDVYRGNIHMNVRMNDDSGTKYIGVNANIHFNGMRNDGSMDYGDHLTKTLAHDSTLHDYGYSNSLMRFRTGSLGIGDTVSTKTLALLDELLKFCQDNEIIVVGFLPPLPSKVMRILKSEGKHHFMDHIFEEADPIFRRYGFELHNMVEPEDYNSRDSEMIDGIHGSDVVYGRMLLKMLQHKSILNSVSDSTALSDLIDHRKSALKIL